MKIKSISIGTASFGLEYGVKKKKALNLDKIRKILNYAKSKKINSIDTAHLYGSAEEKLGKIGIKDWKISTKFPDPGNINSFNIDNFITNKLLISMKRLRVSKIETLFFHNRISFKNFNKSKKIFSIMQNLKKRNLISQIGCIIYEPNVLKQITNDFKIDVVQAPANIIDQRIFDKDIQVVLKKNNIKLELRSIFLQGLLLNNTNNLPKKLKEFKNVFKLINNFSSNKHTKISNLFNFLKNKTYNKVVIGFRSKAELKEIVENMNKKNSELTDIKIIGKKKLINSYLW